MSFYVFFMLKSVVFSSFDATWTREFLTPVKLFRAKRGRRLSWVSGIVLKKKKMDEKKGTTTTTTTFFVPPPPISLANLKKSLKKFHFLKKISTRNEIFCTIELYKNNSIRCRFLLRISYNSKFFWRSRIIVNLSVIFSKDFLRIFYSKFLKDFL